MSYLVGIDIGGTFTDCAIVDRAGKLLTTKVPSTPPDFSRGMLDALGAGAQAIAICFLLSFRNPAHEQRVKGLVEKISGDVFVTCSVDIAPKWGEYERVTATALNAYLGPVMSGYLQKLDFSLKDLGYRHGLQITQCGGGTVPVGRAGDAPLLRLDSGPVSGVTASMFLGAAMGEKNVITTDMGGTSFDVSIIHHGKPAYSFISNT